MSSKDPFRKTVRKGKTLGGDAVRSAEGGGIGRGKTLALDGGLFNDVEGGALNKVLTKAEGGALNKVAGAARKLNLVKKLAAEDDSPVLGRSQTQPVAEPEVMSPTSSLSTPAARRQIMANARRRSLTLALDEPDSPPRRASFKVACKAVFDGVRKVHIGEKLADALSSAHNEHKIKDQIRELALESLSAANWNAFTKSLDDIVNHMESLEKEGKGHMDLEELKHDVIGMNSLLKDQQEAEIELAKIRKEIEDLLKKAHPQQEKLDTLMAKRNAVVSMVSSSRSRTRNIHKGVMGLCAPAVTTAARRLRKRASAQKASVSETTKAGDSLGLSLEGSQIKPAEDEEEMYEKMIGTLSEDVRQHLIEHLISSMQSHDQESQELCKTELRLQLGLKAEDSIGVAFRVLQRTAWQGLTNNALDVWVSPFEKEANAISDMADKHQRAFQEQELTRQARELGRASILAETSMSLLIRPVSASSGLTCSTPREAAAKIDEEAAPIETHALDDGASDVCAEHCSVGSSSAAPSRAESPTNSDKLTAFAFPVILPDDWLTAPPLEIPEIPVAPEAVQDEGLTNKQLQSMRWGHLRAQKQMCCGRNTAWLQQVCSPRSKPFSSTFLPHIQSARGDGTSSKPVGLLLLVEENISPKSARLRSRCVERSAERRAMEADEPRLLDGFHLPHVRNDLRKTELYGRAAVLAGEPDLQ